MKLMNSVAILSNEQHQHGLTSCPTMQLHFECMNHSVDRTEFKRCNADSRSPIHAVYLSLAHPLN